MANEIEIARAFFETLLETERFSERQLHDYQARLIGPLFRHAEANTGFYRGRLPTGAIDVAGPEWLAVPTINRETLATHLDSIRAERMPEHHGMLKPMQSGGSTGTPVQVVLSDLESISQIVHTYRMFAAYGFDQSLPLFMIRNRQMGAGRTDRLVFRKWGFPWRDEEQLGDRIQIKMTTPVDEQLDRLSAKAPAYVNTLPLNTLRLGRAARNRETRPAIPFLISVADFLGDEVKALAERSFGSRVINILSSTEGGVIAIQCPDSPNLHLQSETVLVEVLADDGQPCRAGEAGEIVVTPMYNYASPLIRYRTGDYVVKGGPCVCGRSNPTIERILGRRQHMFCFPDGSRRQPAIDRIGISDLIGHESWQFVQTGRDTAELCFEPSPQLTRGTAEAIRKSLMTAVDSALSVSLRGVPEMSLPRGGKRHFCHNAWMTGQHW
jgi:phenylacetate-coenzyme A ligase PaaK-like adenylate-forming protein